MSDLNDLNRPVTTDTEPNVLDTLRAHIIRAATWSGWSGTANKVAGLMSGVTAAVSGGRSLRLYRRNDTNSADEEVVSLPGVSIGGLAAGLSNKADYLVRLPAISSTEIDSAIERGFRPVDYSGLFTSSLLCWDTDGSTGTVQLEVYYYGTMRFRSRTNGTDWTAWRTSVTDQNIATLVAGLHAATATKLSTTRANWVGSGVQDSVVGQMVWRSFGNDHTVFDASAGLDPNGNSINNTNSYGPWTPTCPTLMGFNGSNTYGVRVDSAREADHVKADVGISIASDSTVNLNTGAPNTRHITITGTTAITAFTVAAGLVYFVRFAGALTLANNANIVTQTGSSIATQAGDTLILRATAANVVEVLCYREGRWGAAPGAAPMYACRAWVNFNGTGTVAIRASGNVSSVTDNGTGDYTINFLTAMPDANYAVTFGMFDSITGEAPPKILTAPLASSVRVGWGNAGGGADNIIFTAAIFR